MSDEDFFSDELETETWMDDFHDRAVSPEVKLHDEKGGSEPHFIPPEEGEKDLEAEAAHLSLAQKFVDTLVDMPELSHKQKKIAFWLARGASSREAAWRAGATDGYTRQMRRHPGVKKFIEILKSGKYIDIIDELSATQILEHAAAFAAETLADLMVTGDTDAVRASAARDILKMTGHYGDDGDKVTIVLGDEVIKSYQEAKREIATVIDEQALDAATSSPPHQDPENG